MDDGRITDALLGGDTGGGRPKLPRLAKIDPAYVSGLPKLRFDGETSVTQKAYPYLAGYSPVADERVIVQPLDGGGWIIVGAVVA